MQEVVLVIGPQASGKSTITESYKQKGYVQVSRDIAGGKIVDLVPMMEAELSKGHSVVLDNTMPLVEVRRPFIEASKTKKVPIICKWMDTSIEDAQINALHRMWARYGKIFFSPEDLKEVKNDPNMFPAAVLFRYRKEFQKPTTAEGFVRVEKHHFERHPYDPQEYPNKALILDFDDTLRVSKGNKNYPVIKEEIALLPGRAEVLKAWKKKGYLLLGASNQSAIAKNEYSYADAEAMFAHTCKLLGVDIEVKFCPHRIPPMTCYCRKPGSGVAVHFIEKHCLQPKDCIFVGDMTSDKTFATRVGFQFVDQSEFFKQS